MKKIIAFLSLSTLVACNDTPAPLAKVPGADTLSTAPRPVGRKPQLASIEYASVIDYCMSNDSLSMWGTLCKYSKWAKEVHNGQFTLLCPTNDVLNAKGRDLMAELKNPKNKELLNKLMASHLLKNVVTDKELAEEASGNENALGKKVEVGAGLIGETKYRGMSIYTQHGTVVVLADVIDFPEAELRAAVARAAQK